MKVHSPWHYWSGLKWRLLIFPEGNAVEADISIYLECGGPCAPPSDAATITAPVDVEAAIDEILPKPETGLEANVKEAAPTPTLPTFWRRPARFWLSLLPTPRTKPRATPPVKDAPHTFTEKEGDWGFREFCRLTTIDKDGFCDASGGITVHARIKLEDAAADGMFNHGTWDSRKMTGFVGFKNQGATCYMNSLLQTLYMLGAFRRAVYSMPLPNAEDEAQGGSRMSYALQKVFYELQHSETTVKTKKLTESFGWDNTDAFTQHDVQELNRILCDHLEERMKKIAPDKPNTISELFEGKILNYIECTNVAYKSTREESFYDLSLNVKGCHDLKESFDKYCEVETMDGDNKYRADGYEELQEARKGVRFLTLPPVLQLHLKRFEYDFSRDAMVKINDRFEYPTEIDLSAYVDGSSPGTDVYILHSVLVHIGDVNGGHYYAYIRPNAPEGTPAANATSEAEPTDEEMEITPAADPPQQPQQLPPTSAPPPLTPPIWYKFDDDMVTVTSEDAAVVENYGSGGERDTAMLNDLSVNNGDLNGTQTPPPSVYQHSRVRNYAARRLSNAYMLQYVRKEKAVDVLRPALDEDVPETLAKCIVSEQEEEEGAKRARAEQHLYMNVVVATDKDLSEHKNADFMAWDALRTIRVKRAMLLQELKVKLVSERLISNPGQMRLWKCVARRNSTIRPDTLLADGINENPIAEPSKDMSPMNNTSYSINYNMRYNMNNEDLLRLYVEDFQSEYCVSAGEEYLSAVAESHKIRERGGDDSEVHKLIPANGFCLKKNEMIVFVKRFLPSPYASLEWVGHAVLPRDMVIADFLPRLRQFVSRQPHYDIPLREDSRLVLFEEMSIERVDPIDEAKSFAGAGIPHPTGLGGDIITFVDEQAACEVLEKGRLVPDEGTSRLFPYGPDYEAPLFGRPMARPVDFYNFLMYRVKIEFKDKYDVNVGGGSDENGVAMMGGGGDVTGITLEFLYVDQCSLVKVVLAEALGDGADANHLRLYMHDFHHDAAAPDPVRCMENDEIRRILPNQSLAVGNETRVLWYERTEYPLEDYEGNDEIRVVFRPDGGTRATPIRVGASASSPDSSPTAGETAAASPTSNGDNEDSDAVMAERKVAKSPAAPRALSVLVQHGSKYVDVVNAVKLKLGLADETMIRLCEVRGCRVSRFLRPGEPIARSSLPNYMSTEFGNELRVEPIPFKEEAGINLDDPDGVVPGRGDIVEVSVAHLAKRPFKAISYFGVPFVILVSSQGETVGSLRERIRRRLLVSEEVFSSWRLAQVGPSEKVSFLEDEEVLWLPEFHNHGVENHSLAIEHHGTVATRKASAAQLRFADAHKPLRIAG